MKKLFSISVFFSLLFLFYFNTLAEVPQIINYQGKLTTNTGASVNDTLPMVFTIYSDTGGTTPLWTETQPAVIVEKGVFNVLLGSVDSIPYSVFDDSIRYLGVKVGGDPEITPRKPMVSVAYAYKANTDGDWIIDGDNIYRLQGNVGIGTTSPEVKLHIVGSSVTQEEGDLKIETPDGDQIRIIDRRPDGGDWIIGASRGMGQFGIYDKTNAREALVINTSGNVGVGTTNPTNTYSAAGGAWGDSIKLHVWNANILVERSARPAIYLKENWGSAGIWGIINDGGDAGRLKFMWGTNTKMAIWPDGNVGIGTDDPLGYKLAVNGSAAKPGGGSWDNFSDIRLKEISSNYEYGLSEISKLRPVHYTYKKGNELGLPSDQEFVGLVAQDVEQVIPDAVKRSDKGYLMLNNDPIIWAMLNAIKELRAENEILKQRIEALEEK
jgi:hypothetical protein